MFQKIIAEEAAERERAAAAELEEMERLKTEGMATTNTNNQVRALFAH